MEFSFYSWAFLLLLFFVAITIDLKITSTRARLPSIKKSAFFSFIWFTLACIVGIYVHINTQAALTVEFFTAYFVELFLSIDNVFVFIIIFKYLNLTPKEQHKVLFLGVLGAIIFRFIMILFGVYVVNLYTWIFLAFGILLIHSGYKLFYIDEVNSIKKDKSIISFLKKFLLYEENITYKAPFFVENRRIGITKLGLAIILVEKADLIFAMDSIPAVLAISENPFIIFSSNILAILGLRSMYFIIAEALRKFKYLKQGVSCILMWIGLKMIFIFCNIEVSNYISMALIFFFIFGSITVSIFSKEC